MLMALKEGDWSDGPVRLMMGDALVRLREMEAESVQCVVTSPPYWGLRDYKVVGQLGLETTPEAYVFQMVTYFQEVRRVLRKDGTLWLNLGDGYASSPPGNTNTGVEKWASSGLHGAVSEAYAKTLDASVSTRRSTLAPGLKAKDLIGIPWQVALALRANGWYLRSDIVWYKPNPMPESVQDRPTKAHEYLFLLSRSERYYYDAAAIREPAEDIGRYTKMPGGWDTGAGGHGSFHRNGREKGERRDKQRGHGRRHAGFNDRWDAMPRGEQMADGRNKRSVWEIATQPYPEAHFATFPEALVEPCIRAGSREGDLVLDPFAGSGTTLAVARRLGRRAVGIELQPDYLPLIQRRVREAALPLVEVMTATTEPSFSVSERA